MGKLLDALPECFLKKVLKDENDEVVENLLLIKNQYEKEQDKEKKVVFRDRLASAFWNLYTEVGKRLSETTPKEKRMFIRFGILDLKYLSEEEQRLVLSQKFEEIDPENTVYYMDEWLLEVLKGKIKPSTTDEQPTRKTPEGQNAANQAKLDRLTGILDLEKKNYASAVDRRKMMEDALLSMVNTLIMHSSEPLLGFPENYSEDQLKRLEELSETGRELRKIDKEMASYRRSYYDKYDELKTLEGETSNGDTPQQQTYAVDARTAESEVNSLRQMIKMCIGRQGNHFPILVGSFMPKETKDYNFKARAYERIKELENTDPSIFERTFRQNTHRIPPYVILTPGYGNFGICWEPYDKYNKATSKGRIAIPIFSRNPKLSATIALGDFRWQVAKEMAGYHWMDEGLTGRYYEYTQSAKIKGDIKTQFINDYILWIMKEAEGIQKLESQDCRYIFWRFIPFPDKLKEDLSNRGYYYNDLYKKEMSFRMSQGK